MDQDQQGLRMGPKGPTDGAEGGNSPQELEKARKAGYFSCIIRKKKHALGIVFNFNISFFAPSDL